MAETIVFQEYKGQQLTREEIDLLEFYEELKIQQEAETREKRSGLSVLGADTDESRKRLSMTSSKDESKIKKLRAPKSTKREPLPLSDLPANQLDATRYPAEGLVFNRDWRPASNQELSVELTEFGFRKNQTLAMKITVPDSSKRWSFNVCPPDHRSFEEILYHFNPRRFKRQELVENDKTDGTWGRADRHPLNQLPPLFDCSYELMLQITADGFHIYVDGQHATSFFHRRDVSEYQSLVLSFPLVDDYGDTEDVVLHKVWWGMKEETTFDYAADMFSTFDQDNRTNLFINGLPKVEDGADREAMEERLYELFQEFSPVACRVVPGKGYAFMKVQSPDAAASAIHHLQRYDAGDFIVNVNYAKQRFKAT